VTQIFHNGQPSHGGDRKSFEVMTDDVFSLNNSRFGDFVDRIYLIELEIKDTTDTGLSVEKHLHQR
jgi:hypothetical protein